MAVNLKELAEILGLSVSAVSCAIRGEGRISEATRQRVLEAAAEYDYVPNESARNLRGVDNLTLAVVIPAYAELYYLKIVQALEKISVRKGYLLTVYCYECDRMQQKKIISHLQTKKYSGIIIAPFGREDDIYDRYLQKPDSTPMVFFNLPPKTDKPYYYSRFDNFEGAYKLTEYLIGLGHRKIAMLSCEIARTRREGFLACLKKYDLEPVHSPEEFVGCNSVSSGEQLMKKLNESGLEYSAVIGSNDRLSFGALKYCKEHGISVPGDLSLAGFDAVEETGIVSPTITMIRQDFDLVAEHIFTLLELQKEGHREGKKLVAEALLVERESTGKIIQGGM